MKKMLMDAEPHTIIAVHNHPGSSLPSISDIIVCAKRKYKYGIVVCHDGKIYQYSVDEKRFNRIMADSALERMEKTGYTDTVKKMFFDLGVETRVL